MRYSIPFIWTTCRPELVKIEIGPSWEITMAEAAGSSCTNLAADWWRMFGPTTLARFAAESHDALLRRVDELVRDRQFRDGGWFADYVRLRFVAVRL